MGRLKGNDLQFIATNLQRPIKTLARKDRLWFDFGSANTGRQAHDILKRVYAAEYVISGDVANYTDFNMKFKSEQSAEWVKQDINSSLDEYNAYHEPVGMGGGSTGGSGTGGSGTGGGGTGTGSDSGSSFNLGSTTYIIIGAAAIILILLLWDRKKK